MIRQGRNPAARVYESIGSDFFLAPSPGWLNLGLWDGAGSEDEAETACRRLVVTLASALPAGGVIVDAGNGLGAQDRLIAELVRPRRLVAVNITEWQLAAGQAPAMTRGTTCDATGDRRPYRTLMARAMTSVTRTIEQLASSIIMSLAHGLIAEMSVGLIAVAVQKPSER